MTAFLTINIISKESILHSFDKIATELFNSYLLRVNSSFYRLLDIEFYYNDKDHHIDVYTHGHEQQLNSGKWYFHASGIDLTIGNNIHCGGILIRAIARLDNRVDLARYLQKEQIHGPLNVKSEICSNLHGAFEEKENIFRLESMEGYEVPAFIKPDRYYKTRRVGLSAIKDGGADYYDAKLRYVIFPYLKHKGKTQIAQDMLSEGMTVENINRALGSKFI